VIAALCWGALLALKLTLGHGTLGVSFDWGVLLCIPSFTLGMVLARWYRAPGRYARIVGSDCGTATALALTFAAIQFRLPDILVLPLFCLVILSAALNDGWVQRVLTIRPLYRLGILSYSIYLVHTLLLRPWQLFYQKILHAQLSTGGAAVAVLLLLSIVIACSEVTYRWVETPGREAFGRLARRPRQVLSRRPSFGGEAEQALAAGGVASAEPFA